MVDFTCHFLTNLISIESKKNWHIPWKIFFSRTSPIRFTPPISPPTLCLSISLSLSLSIFLSLPHTLSFSQIEMTVYACVCVFVCLSQTEISCSVSIIWAEIKVTIIGIYSVSLWVGHHSARICVLMKNTIFNVLIVVLFSSICIKNVLKISLVITKERFLFVAFWSDEIIYQIFNQANFGLMVI